MIKRLLCVIALGVVILITGCIDLTTTISVRKDGSGIITEVVYMDESVEAMMKGMMQGMMAEMGAEEGEAEATKDDEDKSLDIEKYKAKASDLGEGVEFVSAKQVSGEDGASGVQVIYSFKDVRKLNVRANPDNPMGDEMAGMMGAESAEEDGGDPITFDFIKGGSPKLIVHMPKKDEPETQEKDPPAEIHEEDPEAAAAGMGMMKQFLGGLRIRVLVDLPDGGIAKTNASFVETVDGKDTVTLLDVAMGEIMSNEKYFKEWESMSEIRDMSEAMEKMKDIPGLKIETAETVEIQMK